ncbi:hypothetical protein ID866_5185 [Astraeus odoratus]|nr:hypothetical protein ID866_5185 [Astraeus odoratus]
MSPPSPPQPPVPYSEFEYAFDPALSSLFPPLPAPLPSSADLFSPAETTDLLGFLDNFNWDFDVDTPLADVSNPSPFSPLNPPLAHPLMVGSNPSSTLPAPPMTIPSNAGDETPLEQKEEEEAPLAQASSRSRSRTRSAKRKDTSEPHQSTRVKPLLSTPQKRLNHIMSEQKRRNAIRDGYAQLIALIAPAGTQSIDLPSRGRPKGSGTNSKGHTKGKSGVLFRAVEYCRWLEEGRDALREERSDIIPGSTCGRSVINALAMTPLPDSLPPWSIPNFVLKIEVLDHEGASIFLESVNPKEALRLAVEASYTWLYTPLTAPRQSFDGVAYTCGSHTDKEIHFSLDYIAGSASRARDEILGVLVHEVVHCYQYNALDTCPGGLIEGIADFVRLNAGYVPPHWKPAGTGRWDQGYDTTAYFLQWVELRRGSGTIRKLNGFLKGRKYDAKIFVAVAGDPVDELWDMYCLELKNDKQKNGVVVI